MTSLKGIGHRPFHSGALVLAAVAMLAIGGAAFAQEPVLDTGPAPETLPAMEETLEVPAGEDTTGLEPAAAAESDSLFAPTGDVMTPLGGLEPVVEEPRVRPLPPIPERRYGLSSRELYQRIYLEDPAAFQQESLAVRQIPVESIQDADLRVMADSLNRRVRLLALQERMMASELEGRPLEVGHVRYQEFLEARLNLLNTMETDLVDRLRLQFAVLDSSIAALDEEIQEHRDIEIDALESYMQQYSQGRYISDANFILGQLLYAKEKQRNVRAMLRYLDEMRRFSMGLLPVMPRQDQMNEAVSVPYYRRVIDLNTNPELVPYSLYSLGKYHLDRAKEYTDRKDVARAEGNRELSREYDGMRIVHMDSSKAYFSRLIVEFNGDSVNVPEAYYVLASHYNLAGGTANRDTAAVYANALARDYWRSPRYQDALMLLAEIHFTNGLAETRDIPRRNRWYSEGLAYLAWLLREIDAYQAEAIPGVTPEKLPMLETGKRDRYLTFMADQICRKFAIAAWNAPPPVQTTVRIVRAAGNPPFGADLLRLVGDKKKSDYNTSTNPQDLVTALMAYDSLLAHYETYEDGPYIQQQIIDNATFLSEDPEERIRIYLEKKLRFFDLFNRNSAWYRHSVASQAVKEAADDSAAVYLETAAKYFYTNAQAAGDREGVRRSLDYFVLYFETYPERPEAYELNWSLATELEQLGDHERAYEQYMRISNAQQSGYRRQAANGAVEAAFRLLDAESNAAPEGQGGEGE